MASDNIDVKEKFFYNNKNHEKENGIYEFGKGRRPFRYERNDEMNGREKEIYLVLADGTVMKGKSFGACGDVIGEVVFTTGMTGYLETLTDPSYYGQIVVQTFPLIGNYGVIPADFESEKPRLSGYIVREWCDFPSNFRSEGNIDTLLKEHHIVGLCDLDTRALTRKLRSAGVMNGMITASLDGFEEKLAKIGAYRVVNAVAAVTETEETVIKPEKTAYRVALWDFGAKGNIIRELVKRGCEVICVPAGITADVIEALHVDGLVLSNGPGDPKENTDIIPEIGRWVKKRIPTFGICLGHQLLALSEGARTEKLKYGHRGANQPVREVATGNILITSQNHGYAVVRESLPAHAELIYENVNDHTCEGVAYRNFPAFSVQFHPEASAGPLDPGFLFDQFITMMDTAKGGKDNAAE